MFLATRPSEAKIQEFIQAQTARPYSYSEVEATRERLPSGYVVDHNRARLGTGKDVFEQAKRALYEWRMFDLGWLEIRPPQTPIEPGRVIAALAHHYGFFSLNACRIVYTIDEGGSAERFGFAYGTLEEHAMSGEERFTVEWHHDDDTVWYDILAMSRPNQWLSRAAYLLTRRVQKRFAADSLHAMVQAASR